MYTGIGYKVYNCKSLSSPTKSGQARVSSGKFKNYLNLNSMDKQYKYVIPIV